MKKFFMNKKTSFNFLYFSKKLMTKTNLIIKDLPKQKSVTIVRTKEHAREVVKKLEQLEMRFHAWDTETIDINPKEQSPVGHGKIICMSCFVGPDIDFGNGPS